MSEITSIKNKIQKSVIDYLFTHATARFRDLRPKGVDTNHLTYHLNKLVRAGWVEKLTDGYRLSVAGLEYADREADASPRIKTIVMFVIQNGDGDLLIEQLSSAPFKGAWTLPCGKLKSSDASVLRAAQRLASDKFSLTVAPTHAGSCYIRIADKGKASFTTLVHVMKFNSDDIRPVLPLAWARPHKLQYYTLAPAVEEIVARSFFNDPFFFEEYETDWYNESV